MAQQQSPWLEGAYGWNFGEGGWNTGMDQNLLKFSFMFDRNVDSITAALPAAINGQAHYLTTDNRLYFAVGTTYFSTPIPKWFTIAVRGTGAIWQFNGAALVQIDSPQQLDSRIDAVEVTVSTLGTAAFQNVEFFAEQSELDVAVATAANYTDALRSDIASNSDPLKGAGQVGFVSSVAYPPGTSGFAIQKAAQSRTIESFGPVDTPASTRATMQTAINFCASNNILLIAGSTEYTIDLSTSSITIPSNFRCDLRGALIKRATGNVTPKDIWINADTVAGNTGLDIRNVRFDGQRTVDSLTNATAAHRFCGLRLVKCSGYLENIRADNTVNGEIQAEGTRGGIMLDQSVDIKAFRLFASGTDGSGVFPYQGKNYIEGVWTSNNTGSGFTSFGCDDNEFHHIYSNGSGYSGVSVNGERMRCSYLYASGSAVGYAGVNIGHDAVGNRATLSQIDNVVAENNAGWGITVIGSQLVTGSNWRADGNSVRNLFVQASAGLRAGKVVTRNAVAEDVRIEGAGDHWIYGDFRGGPFNGISLTTSGATLHLDEDSIVAECGSAGGTTGALNASAGATIICRGQVVGNLRYGAIANGAGAIVDFRGAKLDNNTVADTLTVSGGVIRHELTRFSNDPMSGTLTILSGDTSVVVNNGNSVDAGRIAIMPTDSVSAGAGIPRVSAITVGASFTATVTSAVPSNATYRYILL